MSPGAPPCEPVTWIVSSTTLVGVSKLPEAWPLVLSSVVWAAPTPQPAVAVDPAVELVQRHSRDQGLEEHVAAGEKLRPNYGNAYLRRREREPRAYRGSLAPCS